MTDRTSGSPEDHALAPSPAPYRRGQERSPSNRGARLTVVGSVHCQSLEGQPASTAVRYSKYLGSDEQPYVRRLTLTPDWMALDAGWVKKAGLLVLRNDGIAWRGGAPVKKPGEDVVLVGVISSVCPSQRLDGELDVRPFAVIGPNESVFFAPYGLAELRIRCQSSVKATLTIYPSGETTP